MKTNKMHKAIFAWADGMKMVEIRDKFGVNIRELACELDSVPCRHPDSNKIPCRSSRKRKNGEHACTILADTFFEDKVCPFYKAKGWGE